MRGLFGDWLDLLERGAERNMAAPGPYAGFNSGDDGQGLFFDDYLSWQRIPEFEAFVRTSPAAELAGRCMGAATSRILMDHILIKRERVGLATPWHHDITYMNVAGELSASVWVALDAAEAGIAPEFIAGSHRFDALYAPRHFKDGSGYAADLAQAPEPESLGDHPRVSFDVEPGDALVFHFKTLHGTTARPVERRRGAYSTRWMGEDMRYAGMPDKLSLPWRELEAGAELPRDACPVIWTRPA